MHAIRTICSGVVLVGLAGFGLAILPGCGDGDSSSGTVVKVDEAEQTKTRNAMEDFYKSKSQKKLNEPAKK